MKQTALQWTCKNCRSENLSLENSLLRCPKCGNAQDRNLLTESNSKEVPLPRDYWEPPFPEDRIFWNVDVLRRMYSSIFRSEEPGKYLLYDKESHVRALDKRQLLLTRLAVDYTLDSNNVSFAANNITESYPELMWGDDADKYCLNEDALEKLGLRFLGAVKICGIRGYYMLDTKKGGPHFYTNWMCKELEIFI